MENLAHGVVAASQQRQRADVPSPWDVLWIGTGAALAQCSVDGAMVHTLSRSIIWYRMRLVAGTDDDSAGHKFFERRPFTVRLLADGSDGADDESPGRVKG